MLSLLSAQELADICGGLWHPAPPSGNARGIKIDSRALDKGNIFVALKGARSDGHDFVSQLDATDIFAAIESGAPVVNMISAYGGIRWDSGLSRQFQYEHTQSRIGATPREDPPR